MNISKIDYINEAFILESDDLKTIDKMFNELPGVTKYSIETSDGFTRKFESIAEVLNHENSSKNSIQRLSVKKFSSEYSSQVAINFNTINFNNISYFIEIDDENLLPKIQRILDFVEGIKAWYSKLTKVNFTQSLLLISLLFIFILSILPALGIIEISDVEPSAIEKSFGNLVIAGFF